MDDMEKVIWEVLSTHLDDEKMAADITGDICAMLKERCGFEYEEESIPHMY